jgi:protein ImuA
MVSATRSLTPPAPAWYLPDGLAWHLPGGLAGSAVHEFRGGEGAAHIGFVVLLLAGLPDQKPILWVSFAGDAYPPGLAWLGLDPGRCLFAKAKDDAECLGTLEIALRGGMAGVAEVAGLSRLAAKRLALAAKQGNSIGFLLRQAPAFTPLDSTAPATRWLITPAPGGQLRAELLYAKGGRPGVFFYRIKERIKEADHETPPALALVAERPEFSGERRGFG